MIVYIAWLSYIILCSKKNMKTCAQWSQKNITVKEKCPWFNGDIVRARKRRKRLKMEKKKDKWKLGELQKWKE